MRVIYLPEAEETFFEVSYFVDSINIEGTGDKWVDKFISAVYSYAKPDVTYALCKDDYLASLDLRCININDWIIAFKIEEDVFVVHKIIRGSILF
jgi:hypothetical protein